MQVCVAAAAAATAVDCTHYLEVLLLRLEALDGGDDADLLIARRAQGLCVRERQGERERGRNERRESGVETSSDPYLALTSQLDDMRFCTV